MTSRAKLEAIISAVEGIILIIARQCWAGHGPAHCCPRHHKMTDICQNISDLLCLVSRVYSWKMLILSPLQFAGRCNDKCQLKQQEQNVLLKAGAGPGDGSCISCQLEINIVTFAWCLQPQLLPPARPGWWLLTGLTQNIKNYGQTLSEAARGTTRSNWKVTRHALACFWIHQCKCNDMILCCSVFSTSAFKLRIVVEISNNSLFQWSNMQAMHFRNTCNEFFSLAPHPHPQVWL